MIAEYYAVMKIQKSFTDEYSNIYTLPEGSYYLPVFDTEEEAFKHTNDGKFEMVLIRKEIKNDC